MTAKGKQGGAEARPFIHFPLPRHVVPYDTVVLSRSPSLRVSRAVDNACVLPCPCCYRSANDAAIVIFLVQLRTPGTVINRPISTALGDETESLEMQIKTLRSKPVMEKSDISFSVSFDNSFHAKRSCLFPVFFSFHISLRLRRSNCFPRRGRGRVS